LKKYGEIIFNETSERKFTFISLRVVLIPVSFNSKVYLDELVEDKHIKQEIDDKYKKPSLI
jgi:TnpA family transposase